jgi:hypothetical protein
MASGDCPLSDNHVVSMGFRYEPWLFVRRTLPLRAHYSAGNDASMEPNPGRTVPPSSADNHLHENESASALGTHETLHARCVEAEAPG